MYPLLTRRPTAGERVLERYRRKVDEQKRGMSGALACVPPERLPYIQAKVEGLDLSLKLLERMIREEGL